MTRLAVVGDLSEDVIAHVAINASLTQLARAAEGVLSHEWIATPDCDTADFSGFDGIWCAPASPYASESGAVRAIAYARASGMPFFGSCGGYQHAVLEYARAELGLVDADNTEVNPNAATPLINGLSCALVEVTDGVRLQAGSRVAALVGAEHMDAAYHCSFGVNRAYLPRFEGSDLAFTGFDVDGDPRVFEHRTHPFFIGTAFQPERAALDGDAHAIVSAFVVACQVYHADRTAQLDVNP